MFANDVATHPQSQSRSLLRLRRKERLEDPRQVAPRNARAVIANQNAYSRPAGPPVVPIVNPECELPVVLHRFDRVQHDVREYLPYFARKDAHRSMRSIAPHDLDLMCFEMVRQDSSGFVQNFRQIGRTRRTETFAVRAFLF